MKKVILLIVLLANLQLCVNRQSLCLFFGNSSHAQERCPIIRSDSAPMPGESAGGFFGWLGNALDYLGTAVVNVGKAISNFFDCESGGDDGETFGEELGAGGGWVPPDDPTAFWEPQGDPSNVDPWTDIFGNLAFNTDNFGGDEWNVLDSLQSYYSQYYNGGSVNSNNRTYRYYITIGNTSTRYYQDDKIVLKKKDTTINFVLHKENSSLASDGLEWKKDGTTFANTTVSAPYSLAAGGRFMLRVDSNESKTLIRNPVYIMEKPIIYFQLGLNYKGEYGFDDEAHDYPLITGDPRYSAGTQVTTVSFDSHYKVPWMSLLDGQEATIRMEKIGLEEAYKSDNTFSVRFLSDNPHIKIENADSVNYSYLTMSVKQVLTIKANAFSINDSARVLKNIYAVTNKGDTIGKLHLSCEYPAVRRAHIVFVDIGNGYRTNITKQQILDSLNKNSHNQIFRKWVLDSAHASGGLDTINLTSEYNHDTATFKNADKVLDSMKLYYWNHKNLDLIVDISSSSYDPKTKVYSIFMFNYNLNAVGGATTQADTYFGGHISVHWKESFRQTIAHELGHILRVPHPFAEDGLQRFGVPQFTGTNFMNYYYSGQDFSNMFYYAQWIIAR